MWLRKEPNGGLDRLREKANIWREAFTRLLTVLQSAIVIVMRVTSVAPA